MTTPSNPDSLNYEDAVRELEAVIAALEEPQVALEESIALYERGQALAARCTALLNQAELRLQTLTGRSEEA